MRIITTSFRNQSRFDGTRCSAELEIEFSCHPAEISQVQQMYGQEVSIVPKKDGQRMMFYRTAPKVIFNPPATILFMNGKKYVSKAHNEEFDEEKGLLMCLAKANGITHLQLKKMLKGAKRNGKTSP